MLNRFEDEIENLGKFSKWFLFINILMMYPNLCYFMSSAISSRFGTDFALRCKIPDLENSDWTFNEIKNISQPKIKNKECFYYKYDYEELAFVGFKMANIYVSRMEKPNIVECKKFVVDKTKYYSVFEEFSLMCGGRITEQIFLTAPLYGLLFSCLLFVPLADTLGRKRVLVWGMNMFFISGVFIPFSYGTPGIIFGTFMSGAAYYSMMIPIKSLVVEISNDFHRPHRFVALNVGTALGYIILPLLMLRITNWRFIQLVVSSFLLFLPVVCWYMPESPAWFVTKNSKMKAWPILKSIKDPVAHSELLMYYKNEEVYLENFFQNYIDSNLVRKRKFWLLILTFIIHGMTYFKTYAAKINIDIGVKRPTYLLLAGTTEFLSCTMAICVVFFFKTRISVGLMFAISGILCFVIAYIDAGSWKHLLLSMLIEATTSAGYEITSLYAAEFCPTSHRCTILSLMHAITALSTIIMCHMNQYVTMHVLVHFLGCLSFVGVITIYYSKDSNRECSDIMGVKKVTN